MILLGLTKGIRLNFQENIDDLCCSVSCKIHVLRRIRKCLKLYQVRLLYSAFVNGQFSYASVIWMFSSKTYYKKIQKKIIIQRLKLLLNLFLCKWLCTQGK